MIEPFISRVLEEREVYLAKDDSRIVWRLMSTLDGVGEWRPFHIGANGDILHSLEWCPLPGDEDAKLGVIFGETYH